MRTELFLISFLLLFISIFTIDANFFRTDNLKSIIPENYIIAPWKDFKSGAISYSFDDGLKNQYLVALPLLDKYGFKATFNLITKNTEDWEIFKKASLNGHEIASHTVTHSLLSDKDKDGQEKELKESKETIESKIGKECITIAYPYCRTGTYMEQVAKYYISGRICSNQLISSTPEDMFVLSAFGVGNLTDLSTAERINKVADDAIKENKWVVYLIHGVDDEEYSTLDSKEFESHLIYVKNSNSFWVDTFGNISKFLLERNSLIIDEKEVKKGEFEINVDCSYQTEITKLDFPVTVSREAESEKMAKKLKIAEGSKKGKQVKISINGTRINFDVIPGHKYVLYSSNQYVRLNIILICLLILIFI